MNTFKRGVAGLLATLAFCAAYLGVAMQAQPQPVSQNNDLGKLESADKIDEKMFPDGIAHDFGTVQRGSKVYYAFRIVNTSKIPLKISRITLPMSPGTRVWSSKDEIRLNEETKVEVLMDTGNFRGAWAQAIYVVLEYGRITEHRLWVGAESQENLAFFPDSLVFGKIKPNDVPTKQMIVAVPGQPKLQMTGATCDSKAIEVKVQELGRGSTCAVYQVSATIRAGAPEGELYTSVELTTNNPAMPKLLVPVSANVISAK